MGRRDDEDERYAKQRVHGIHPSLIPKPTGEEVGRYEALVAAIERGEDPAAADAVAVCAFLAPEPVPAAWFPRAAAQLSAPLRYASFLSSCRAPDSMKVQVRVAVRMGRAIGVTVSTNPPNHEIAACIDHAVRGLRWAENAKTDFVTTNY